MSSPSSPSPCLLHVFLVFRGIFDAMDVDGSNDIDIEEFQSALGKMSSKKRPKASKEDMQGEKWERGDKDTLYTAKYKTDRCVRCSVWCVSILTSVTPIQHLLLLSFSPPSLLVCHQP